VSRDQACAHCQRFLIAATRRCGGRVSVLLWLVTLMRSAIRHRLGRPLPYQLPDGPQAPPSATCAFTPTNAGDYGELPSLSRGYAPLWGRSLRVTQPSATTLHRSEGSFDLHILGTPLAFILSQDQTLKIKLVYFLFRNLTISNHIYIVKEPKPNYGNLLYS
jgi:hypothetical protein